jgi:hypothetical protein
LAKHLLLGLMTMKRLLIIAGLITVPLLYVFDNDLADIADFRCEVVKRTIIGYPIRMCSIAFDDKGLIGSIEDRL